MKTKNHKVGRKLFDGKDENSVIQKLEEVWLMGGSDKEASFFADISPVALSDYLKKHPLISERKEAILNSPTLKARRNITNKIEAGDVDTSRWYLEKKHSDEFSTKTINEHRLPDNIKLEIIKKYDDRSNSKNGTIP